MIFGAPKILFKGCMVLLSLAVTAFVAWMILGSLFFGHPENESANEEVHRNLNKMCKGASSYFSKQEIFPHAAFPVLTHTKIPSETRESPEADFDLPVWQNLSFKIDKPTWYQYEYSSANDGNNSSFTVIARGDLDGDGGYSEFKRIGTVQHKGRAKCSNLLIERRNE